LYIDYDPYKNNNDGNSEEESNDEKNQPKCHFNIFFKLKSVNVTTNDELLEYENGIFFFFIIIIYFLI